MCALYISLALRTSQYKASLRGPKAQGLSESSSCVSLGAGVLVS